MGLNSDILKQARFGGRLLVWGPPEQWVAQLDGATQSWGFESKLIDVDSLTGYSISCYYTDDGDGTMLSQSLSSSSSSREFQIYVQSGSLRIIVGGSLTVLANTKSDGIFSFDFYADGKLRVLRNKLIVFDGGYSTGLAREPNANFALMKRGGGYYKAGGCADLSVSKDGIVSYLNSLSDKNSGESQTPSVGVSSALMENYSADVWSEFAGVPTYSDVYDMVFFGASIMEETFKTNLSEVQESLMQNGIPAYCYAYTNRGFDSNQMISVANQVIGDLSSSVNKKMVIIHWGGNDVTNYGPYPGGSYDLNLNCREMLQNFLNAGFEIALSDITYRIPPTSNPSEPYNQNIMNPIITDFADVPLSLYNLSFENQSDWFDVDGVHPSTAGEVMNRNLIVSEVITYVNNKV